ncbi:MAG: hypothetical protein IKN74_00440 [Clostridia bacterium]|nr:hypothetical protein [Clostridia bacterium]
MKKGKSKNNLTKREIIYVIGIVVLSFIIPYLIIAYSNLIKYTKNISFGIDMIIRKNLITYITLSVITFIFLLFCFVNRKKGVIESFYKYRFIIGALIIILSIIFELNGSSIGLFASIFDLPSTSSGDILGKSRMYRTDEYNVHTMMALSQSKTGYKWYNDIFEAHPTNMFIVYGQPVLDISMIFRLFQVGYLILGFSRGLSFFWVTRAVALFLVSIEFGMFITNKNKKLAFVYAFLITFAPIVQWWFAINGLVEMLIAAQLGTIMLDKLLTEEKFSIRVLALATIMICIGTFIMAFYPAWMVPMVYAFMPIIIWDIYKNVKEKNIKEISIKQVIILVLIAAFFIALLVRIFVISKEDIKLIMNTSYPGHRVEDGGGAAKYLFPDFVDPFLSLMEFKLSQPEETIFISFTPIVYFLLIYSIVKKKDLDLFIILLLPPLFIMDVYAVVGLPEVLAKISLLSYSIEYRVAQLSSIIKLLILIRLLSKNYSFKMLFSEIVSLVLVVGFAALAFYVRKDNVLINYYIVSSVVYFVLYSILLCNNQKVLVAFVAIFMLFTGGLVNPIRKGADILDNIEVLNEVKRIDEEDEGLWICPKDYSKNLLMAQNVKFIDSVNIYPVLERWEKIDKEHKYYDNYNRYAHIVTRVRSGFGNADFKNRLNDNFYVFLYENDIKDLGIKYIIYEKNLPEGQENEVEKFIGIKHDIVYENSECYIYKLSY